MKTNPATRIDYQSYLSELLGRASTTSEQLIFEGNQDLLRISKRLQQNSAYHITFTNDTEKQLLSGGVVLGGAIQLHSQQEGHRFYSVYFEEDGEEEGYYLMLDAKVTLTSLNGNVVMLVLGVGLITIEAFVLNYSPKVYILD